MLPAKAAAKAQAAAPAKEKNTAPPPSKEEATQGPKPAAAVKGGIEDVAASAPLAPVAQAGTRFIPMRRQETLPEDKIMYRVRDLLATAGPRTHEFLDRRGVRQKFTFKDDTDYVDVPMSIATKVIGNEGFEVLNQRGMVLRAVRSADTGQQKGIILAHDEIVAKYDELTTDALIERAVAAGFKPEGDDTTRDQLIDFLIETSILVAEGAIAAPKAAPKADAGEDVIDIEEENTH